MKTKLFLLIGLIVMFAFLTNCNNKVTPVYRITFEYESALRIPYHSVKINITLKNDTPKVKVVSEPFIDSIRWEYSKIDTSFEISKSQFQKIMKLVEKVTDKDNEINKGSNGLDGSIWKIELENNDTLKKFEVWSPDYDVETRKLKDFIDAAWLIVKTSNLKPEEILRD